MYSAGSDFITSPHFAGLTKCLVDANKMSIKKEKLNFFLLLLCVSVCVCVCVCVCVAVVVLVVLGNKIILTAGFKKCGYAI